MRIFRLIATPIVLLGLLGLLIWGANWGWKQLTAPLPSPSPTPCIMKPAEHVRSGDTVVRVYNGGFTSGLANREAKRLSDAGFLVQRIDNTDERIRGTVIRGNKSQEAQLRLVRSQFAEPTVETDDRIDGTIDVLLGTDFKGRGREAAGAGPGARGQGVRRCSCGPRRPRRHLRPSRPPARPPDSVSGCYVWK